METLQATGTVRGVFFSLGSTPTTDPKFDCAGAVINLFNQAKKTAHIAIFSLIEPNIVNAIITANKRGIKVSIVADVTQSKNATMSALCNV